jgi:hypothetical protein
MVTPHQGVEGFIASEKKNFDAFADWQMPLISISGLPSSVQPPIPPFRYRSTVSHDSLYL